MMKVQTLLKPNQLCVEILDINIIRVTHTLRHARGTRDVDFRKRERNQKRSNGFLSLRVVLLKIP